MQWQSQKEIDPLKISNLEDKNEQYYPFYGQSTINNGIISYQRLSKNVLNNFEGKPTILIHSNNQNIVYVNTPFYLKDGHGATSVLQSKHLNDSNQMFITSSIDKVIKNNFSYNKKATKVQLKNSSVKLPFENNTINYQIMEDIIYEVEKDLLSRLKKYLTSNGLIQYKLTLNEQTVFEDFKNDNLEWKEFRVIDIFNINTSKKRFNANKVNISTIGYPYVVRTSLNNGIRGYIDEDERYLNNGKTISFGQDTATMFYQRSPYFTGDKIKILEAKGQELNRLSGLLYVTALTKSFSAFSWGSSSFNVKIIGNQLIKLPVKHNKPDYYIVHSLISAIQKLVIKDVVLYVERKLAKAKT